MAYMYSERKVRATYGRWTRDQLAGNDITTLGTYVMDQSRITLKTRAVGVNTAIATGYFESASGVGRPYHWARKFGPLRRGPPGFEPIKVGKRCGPFFLVPGE